MQQQQMMMQQQQKLAAMQQMQQQQMGDPKQNIVSTGGIEGFMDTIKTESKSIGLIILLSVVMNVEQVDNLFKMQPGFFVNETGGLNMQSILVKAILIGVLYYLVKTQVF